MARCLPVLKLQELHGQPGRLSCILGRLSQNTRSAWRLCTASFNMGQTSPGLQELLPPAAGARQREPPRSRDAFEGSWESRQRLLGVPTPPHRAVCLQTGGHPQARQLTLLASRWCAAGLGQDTEEAACGKGEAGGRATAPGEAWPGSVCLFLTEPVLPSPSLLRRLHLPLTSWVDGRIK